MKIIKILFLLLIVIGSIGLFYFSKYNNVMKAPIGTTSNKTRFEVVDGMSGLEVLTALANAKIINEESIPYLRIYIKLNNVPAFQKGVYRIPGDLTPVELFETLQKPENPDIWITIPEGLRKDEIASILSNEFSKEAEAVFNKEKFLALTVDATYISGLGLKVDGLSDLEGFLFPDKYLLPKQAEEEYVIQAMINNFIIRTGGTYTYEQIIMASMVEREGYNDTDRPLIADVILKRYNEGWLLQIDATLLYYYKDWKHVITEIDKSTDQPYNTYEKAGLPPTPICNPGLSAINAVKNPKANDYYFYLHDNDGNAHFSKTYQEHRANSLKYLGY